MKKTGKRLTALLLAMAMCLSLLSVNVWAVEPPGDGSVSVQSSEEAPEGSAAEAVEAEQPEAEAPEAEGAAPSENGEAEQAEKQEQKARKGSKLETQAVVASGTCGDSLTWTLDDAGTMTISGSGSMGDNGGTFVVPWSANTAQIRTLALPEGLTSIGACAFANCNNLTSVTIPSTVTTIGMRAFAYTALTNVTIPSTVTSLGIGAFSNCKSLSTVTLPAQFEGKKVQCFDGTPWLADNGPVRGNCGNNATWTYDKATSALTISGTGEAEMPVMEDDFRSYYKNDMKSVVVDDGITVLGAYVLSECEQLTSAQLPEGLLTIERGALAHCSCLEEIQIPATVTTIGQEAFSGCDSLTNLTIPGNVTAIGQNAFANCFGLSTVTISEGVTSIGASAFYGCPNLANVIIPRSVTEIGVNAFARKFSYVVLSISGYVGTAAQTYANENNITFKALTDTQPEEPENPNVTASGTCGENVSWSLDAGTLTISGTGEMGFYNVNGIPWYAYRDQIRAVVICSGVTTITYGAFRECTGITSLTIPDSMNSIEIHAFEGCTGLTSVTIPRRTCLRDGVFQGCTSLREVSFNGSIPVWWEHNAFWNTPWFEEYLNKNTLPLTLETESEITITEDNPTAWFSFRPAESGDYALALPSFDDSLLPVRDAYGKQPSKKVSHRDGFTHFRWTLEAGVTYYYRISSYFGGGDSVTYQLKMTKYTAPTSGGFNYDGTVNWAFEESTGTLTVSGEGDITYSSYALNEFKDSIISVVIEDGVTGIGEYAFDGCTNLSSVTIPDSVTSIGRCAFHSTKWLQDKGDFPVWKGVLLEYQGSAENVVIPADAGITAIGEGAFYWNDKVKSVVIPAGVTEIWDAAFRSCTSLQSVTIGNNVTRIGKDAFGDCPKLAGVTIPNSVTELGEDAFCGSGLSTLTIGSGVTTIGRCAFAACPNLTEVTIPDGVTSIGEEAFTECPNLEKVTIGNGVTDIGDHAFCDCQKLNEVIFGSKVQRIGGQAFRYCPSLTSISLPGSLVELDGDVFSECPGLKSISVDESNESFCSVDGVLFNKHQTMLLCYPASKEQQIYQIPESVTSIEEYAFCRSSQLVEISIPDTVTRIGREAFYGCNALRSVDIPEGVTVLEDGTFCHCTALTKVSISQSVTSIEENVFFNCTSLKNVTIPASVESIQWLAFGYCGPSEYGDNIKRVSGFTITGTQGSAAEAYATRNNFSFIALAEQPTQGDLTGDSDITMADVTLGNQAVVGLIQLTEEQRIIADVTGDEEYTMADVVWTNGYVLGKHTTRVKNHG